MHAAAARSASALGTARQWQHSFSVSIAIARTWKGGKGIGNGHCDAKSCACTVCEEKGDDCQLPPVALSKESFNRVVGPNNARHSSLEISPPHANGSQSEDSLASKLKSGAPHSRESKIMGTGCAPLSPFIPLDLSTPSALSIATAMGALLNDGT
jgi:hypothetical protein